MTRQAAPDSKPVVLTVAGSDSGGGAGIQADLKTIEACGGFGTSAVTSVTAQNTTGVESTHVLPVEEIEAQCSAVLSDFDVAAVKTGMLATADVVELVTDRVADLDAPAVVDPVMVAASGDRLLAREAESAYEGLVSEATLVTPNADEAAVLTDVDPADEATAREAGERLVGMGADAALVTGGHIGDDAVVDVLVTGDSVETFRHPRVDTAATHGSGCALSSAIATHLARDADLPAAVGSGVELLARAVRYNLDVGEGPGAVHHLVELRDEAARESTAEAVRRVVDAFEDRDVCPLVPEVGTNVAGATPYAERPDEAAAVEGRITRTRSGARANRGVRFGASTYVAGAVLAAREVDAGIRFGANVRYNDVANAFDAAGIPVAAFDRDEVGAAGGDDASDADTGGTDGDGKLSTARGVQRAVTALADAGADVAGEPVAAVDSGAPGEAIAYLLAGEADALVAATGRVLDELPD
jgi:hydroxymethylpyrimidine/phosphomethylpyrimidine kinase